jgi:hypothetical protein
MDALVYEKTTTKIMKEMQALIDKKRQKMQLGINDSEEQEGGDQDDVVEEVVAVGQQASQASCTDPPPLVASSRTTSKKKGCSCILQANANQATKN